MRIILASKSPRRKDLLTVAGLDFEVQQSALDEDSVSANTPQELALKLAELKAVDIANQNKSELILGADTIVVSSRLGSNVGTKYGDMIVLGKPRDKNEARAMLEVLSDAEHVVMTAFALICLERNIRIVKNIETVVRFRKIINSELDLYLETTEPYDKAGAYAAQGFAQSFITSISGSYTSVIGLPLSEVVTEIRGIFERNN